MTNNKLTKNVSVALLTINVLVVILVSSTLRSPIISVSPVLTQIQAQMHIDNFQSSMLTSIPLFVFATCSVLVSRFSHKYKIPTFLLFALITLSLGLFVRISGSITTLFLGSFMIGLGICVGNVIIPGYIKNNFPKQIGLMTGIFAVSMNLTAALASGFSVKIGQWTGMGWKGSLGVWIIVALLAMVTIVIELLFSRGTNNAAKKATKDDDFKMSKSAQAWNVSIFMGLQSLFYYCLVSWLPSVLNDYGMSGNQPGWILFIIQITMLPVTFICPIIANKMKDQRLLMVITCVVNLICAVMFIVFRANLIYVNAVLLGISNGLSFSLAILFFSLRTKNSANAIKISGMAQSIGYLIAAFGPPIFGKLHDWNNSWDNSFVFLVVCAVLMFFFGMKAASNKYVEGN